MRSFHRLIPSDKRPQDSHGHNRVPPVCLRGFDNIYNERCLQQGWCQVGSDWPNTYRSFGRFIDETQTFHSLFSTPQKHVTVLPATLYRSAKILERHIQAHIFNIVDHMVRLREAVQTVV
jgi:hypothetical protein